MIYLAKEDDDEATNLLLAKYSVLISKKIKEFGLQTEYDDAFQEGLLVLYKSIIRYYDRGFSFYTFFITGLKNKLITLSSKARHTSLLYDEEESECFMDSLTPLDEDQTQLKNRLFAGLTEKERQIVERHCLEKVPVKVIAKDYQMTEYAVYASIKRAKNKIKGNI